MNMSRMIRSLEKEGQTSKSFETKPVVEEIEATWKAA